MVFIPPPTPRPGPDPTEDVPKWTWDRQFRGLPVRKGDKEWSLIGDTPKGDDDPDWRGVRKSQIQKWPVPEERKLGQSTYSGYYWFDTPDYADPFKKLGFAAKVFGSTGILMASLYGALFQNQPYSLQGNFKLMATKALPWFVAGMAASATVIVAANVRGNKDDLKNYALAGAVMATINSKANHASFVRNLLLWIPAGLIIKYGNETNAHFRPIIDFRGAQYGMFGMPGEGSPLKGDFRFGLPSQCVSGDPGRDVDVRAAGF